MSEQVFCNIHKIQLLPKYECHLCRENEEYRHPPADAKWPKRKDPNEGFLGHNGDGIPEFSDEGKYNACFNACHDQFTAELRRVGVI
jgi:hypothetical protein